MRTYEEALSIVARGKGCKYFFIDCRGRVTRDIELTRVEGDRIYGMVDDATTTGSPGSKFEAAFPYAEIILDGQDPRDGLPAFAIEIHEAKNGSRIFEASYLFQEGRAFGYTVSDALSALQRHKYSNPPDCNCEHIHCSSRTCRSVVPSHGAYQEKERMYPAPVS